MKTNILLKTQLAIKTVIGRVTQQIPNELLLLMITIYIIQLCSLFLPFGFHNDTAFDNVNWLYFIVSSIFLGCTIIWQRKRYFLYSILTSTIVIWMYFDSFLIRDRSDAFGMWIYRSPPLIGAYIFLVGIIGNCILLFFWSKQYSYKSITTEARFDKYLDYRNTFLAIIFGFAFAITPYSSINNLFYYFFPFTRNILDILVPIDNDIIIYRIFISLQIISSLYCTLIQKQSRNSLLGHLKQYIKYSEVWFLSCFMALSFTYYEDIVFFIGVSILLTLPIIVSDFVISYIIMKIFKKPWKKLVNFTNNFSRQMKISLTRIHNQIDCRLPYFILLTILYIGGFYLITDKILDPILTYLNSQEIVFLIMDLLFMVCCMSISQWISVRRFKHEIRNLTLQFIMIFLVVQQLSIWGFYINFWLPNDSFPFEFLLDYLNRILIWRIAEIPIAVLLIVSIHNLAMKKKN